MAASILQSAVAAASGATITATLGSTPTLGNTIVAIANSNNVISINGTGWTQRAHFLGDQDFYIWTRPTVSSDVSAFTITPAATDDASIVVLELTGVLAAPFDVVGTIINASGASTTQVAPTITTTAAGDIVLVAHAVHGIEASYTGAVAYNNSFTAAAAANPVTGALSASKTAMLVGQKIQATAGTVGATTITTTGTTQNRASVQIAFKPSTGGTPGDVAAVVATVNVLAPIPTVTGASNVSGGGVATATMQALAPVVTGVSAGSVTAVRATATALAPVPLVTGLQTSTVVAVRGIVTSLALPPMVTGLVAATVAGTVATASTLAPSPVVAGSVSASVSAVVATASTLALPPIVSAGGVANVSAVTATVSTLAPVPVVAGLRVASVVAVRGIVTAQSPHPTVSASSSANVTAVPALATVQALAPTVNASSGSLVLAVVALATMRAYAPSVSPSPSATFEFDYRTSSWVGDAGTNQTWKPLEGPDAWV